MGMLFYVPRGTPDEGGKEVASLARRDVTSGPDSSGPGRVYGMGENKWLGYYPEKQEWWLHDSGKIWFGWCHESRPTPEELAKPDQLPGHYVELGDGNKWLIPMAQQFVLQPNGEMLVELALPRYYEIKEDGEWGYGPIIDEYAELGKLADHWWDWSVAPEVARAMDDKQEGEIERPYKLTRAWVGSAACKLLATNYQLTPIMVWRLKLMVTSKEQDVLNALVDFPTFLQRIEKKNQ